VIAARGLGHRVGGRPLLAGLSFEVERGGRLAVVGPSGSGKTTLLRILAGLEAPGAGEVRIAGVLASAAGEVLVSPHRRGIGFAFQQPLLWPHLRVGANVAFGVHGLPDSAVRSRVAELLERCGLAGCASRFPDELSGGEAARVGLARALATRPRLLLLDEPFASVEADLRDRLAGVVRDELAATGATLVYATHDEGVLHLLEGKRLDLAPGARAGAAGA
jgi:iron(III) transport system ATP-binding protein